MSQNEQHGAFKRLYHGETKADIVGRWKVWFGISAVLLLIGLGAVAAGGLNLGIDFTGGTVWEVKAGDAQVQEVSDAMVALGYQDAQVQEITATSNGKSTRFLRVEAESAAEPDSATTKALDKAKADLDSLEKDVPENARSNIGAVSDNLDGVHGPFKVAVPEPLEKLQAEIDALPDTLAKAQTAKGKTTAAKAAAARMELQVEALINLEDAERSELASTVTEELAKLTGTPASQVTVDTVGPSWGKQISEKARNALVVFLIAITIFITIRFELKMAIATVVALFHDLLMVIGLYAVFGFPVTPATVIALLTMLGFSIYDGIVVFDRVNENTRLVSAKGKMTYTEMANFSLNQVLMRSLNTSITSLLPILSVLVVGAFILGASTLEEFGLALFLGLLSGAYSSIFIATPLLAILKEREPRYREIRERLKTQRATGVRPTADGDEDDDPGADDDMVAAGNPLAPGQAPRPRKNKR